MSRQKKELEYEGKVYALTEMMNHLLLLTEEQWGLYAFSREALRGKISIPNRIQLSLEASKCGKEEAVRVNEERGILSVESYINRQGLDIQRIPQANDGGFLIFAQFKPPQKIILFTDCLLKAEHLIKKYEELPFKEIKEVEDLLLAHELFHYVETQKKKELFTQSYRLPLWKLGCIQYSSQVGCLGEIAGMSFAAALCGTTYSPYLLDVFLVYGYSPQAASNLYEGILRAVKPKEKKEINE